MSLEHQARAGVHLTILFFYFDITGASHHERATTEEDSHSSSETEYTFCSCSNVCPNGWEKDGNNICYGMKCVANSILVCSATKGILSYCSSC